MGKMLLNGTVVTPLIVKGDGTKINNQDITVTENGTYTAEDGYTGLGTVNVNVPTGGGSEERFGVPYDSIVGTVDQDGNYVLPKKVIEVNLSGVKHVSTNALQYAFTGKAIKKFFCNDLISCDANAFFSVCLSVLSTQTEPLIFSCDSIEIVAARSAFSSSCSGVIYVEPSFKKLRVISGNDAFNGAFGSTKIQPDKVFPVLEEITGQGAFSQFRNVSVGDKLYFSKVKKIVGGASYATTMNFYSKVKYYYPRLTEVSKYIAYSSGVSEFHFAKAHQALLEACEGYDYKWCGANPDIYFDLMLKITVNGTVYDREHTIDNYTSWSDTDGNLVYTNADTEPDIGTVVYSDQGTTQVGTVTEVE